MNVDFAPGRRRSQVEEDAILGKNLQKLQLGDALLGESTDTDVFPPTPTEEVPASKDPIGYKMGKVLGMGKHGEVKKAVHTKSGREVAIKIMAREDCPEDAWSEVAALKILKHPHIVRLYDVMRAPDNVLLVLECLQGGELFDYLVSRQRLSEREGQRFVRQILSALDYSHKIGVVHRDLKLENLLLDADGNIKVTDFGFSNVFRDGSLMSTFVGSPAYAAPEIIANEKYCGPAADVWSLGVIIYTIITGQQPFSEENAAANLMKIDAASYELPDHLSDEAKDLISNILVRDPAKRLTVAQLWQHPWIAEGHSSPLVVSAEEMPEDVCEKAYKEAERLGYDVEALRVAVNDNIMCEMTATYYLLLEKFDVEKKQEAKDAEIAAASAALTALLGSGLGRIRAVQSNKPWNQPPPDMVKAKPSTPPNRSRPGSQRNRAVSVNCRLNCENPKPAPVPRRDSSQELHKAVLIRNSSRHALSKQGSLEKMDLESVPESAPKRKRNTAEEESRIRSSTWSNAQTRKERKERKMPPAVAPKPKSKRKSSDDFSRMRSAPGSPTPQSSRMSCSVPASPIRLRPTRGRPSAPSPGVFQRVQACRSPGAARRNFDGAKRARRGTHQINRVTTLGETVTTETILAPPQVRPPKRTNTAPELADKIHKSLDLATTMQAFGAATTSSLSVADIMDEIISACKKEFITFKRLTPHKILCECRPTAARSESSRRRSSWTHAELVCWEMEICLLAQLGLHGIKLHRISGDLWKYKSRIAALMRWMKL